MSRVIENGVVVTAYSTPRIIPDGAVAWDRDRIVFVGTRAELRKAFPDAPRLDAGGGLILPGLVNLHHHFYSALARGLDPGAPVRSFAEVLDRLWWRLDRALDPETVRLSAQLSAADCVRWGCTTVFDHHASPSCIDGSLDRIADVIEESGLSAVLCYEITDRNGHDQALAGLEENLRFIESRRGDPRIRGVLGMHASFTLREETLAEAARRRPSDAGCHIHVAEDPLDVSESVRAFGMGPVERLERFGLLDERALLAHGIHLGRDDYGRVAEHGAVIIHNPESNANNGVGHLDVPGAADAGCRVGLGTDGMSSSVLGALRAAFLAERARTADPSSGFRVLPGLLHDNAFVAGRFLEEPLLGSLVPAAPADIIAVDANPPTPLTAGNLQGHLIYGAGAARVRHTIARGHVVMEDFDLKTIDPDAVAALARAASPLVWERFGDLAYGTPYLGPPVR